MKSSVILGSLLLVALISTNNSLLAQEMSAGGRPIAPAPSELTALTAERLYLENEASRINKAQHRANERRDELTQKAKDIERRWKDNEHFAERNCSEKKRDGTLLFYPNKFYAYNLWAERAKNLRSMRESNKRDFSRLKESQKSIAKDSAQLSERMASYNDKVRAYNSKLRAIQDATVPSGSVMTDKGVQKINPFLPYP